jgi:site-specific DNA-methyltransferase (adenine-specific)
MQPVIIGNATLYLGDCTDALKTMPDNSVDSITTDPPYGLSFMGKRWDYDVPGVEVWAECLRVLKPGGHLLAFAGTRTQHRMAVRIEDAGFEIRDMIAWVYGSGFPKSLDVSKAIDKAAGAEREVVGTVDPRGTFDGRERKSAAINTNWRGAEGREDVRDLSQKQITAPATEAARQWQGWGTALKPALEPITVARKPLIGTVAANVLEHGTGALNIDGCRVATNESQSRPRGSFPHSDDAWGDGRPNEVSQTHAAGRWPANLIHDGSAEVLAMFPQSSAKNGVTQGEGKGGIWSESTGKRAGPTHGDAGSAARFFYCAKASKKDRDEGLENMPSVHRPNGNKWTDQDYRVSRGERPPSAESGPRKNAHPTVKPTELMRYLCRLVTPAGGVTLDPFMGSGSTGKAALREGFRFIGIEREVKYFDIACRRIEDAQRMSDMFAHEVRDAYETTQQQADLLEGVK